MDHAETIETEGHSPQNSIADLTLLRGNSMESTEPIKSMANADDDIDMYRDDPVDDHDEALGMMDIDDAGLEEGNANSMDDNDLSSSSEAAVEPTDTTSLLMSAAPSTATTDDPDAGASQMTGQAAFAMADAAHREADSEQTSNGGSPSPGPVGEPAFGSQAIRDRETQVSETIDSLAPHQASSRMRALSEGHSSFDHGLDMSVDEDDTDNHSDRASSVDAQQSDHEILRPPQDQSRPNGVNERAPLENAYGPFIHQTDTSLADARERLQVALEQIRLLRTSFTQQAYDRYRCVMKPVPESLHDIVEPIQSDPSHFGAVIRKQVHEIKVEKDLEKKQAHQAGVGIEEVAYFGEGLHLVVLPEDDIHETEVDLTQFPHRGPTDPETGKSREEISAAAATTTEQVFDRIRRIRAIRMGAEIVPAAGLPNVAPLMIRNPVQNQQALNEPFSPGFATSPSPAPSVDSNAGDNDQNSSKDFLKHLLTLAPDVEGARPDGSLTAVQSALIAHGVGMHEVKRDYRINPLRQRMVQPNYFSPTPSHKLLPPLLGPHQLYRLQAAHSRKKGLEVRTGARESIKSVVEGICSTVDTGKCVKKDDTKKDGSKDGSKDGNSGTDGIGRALAEEHSALETGLLSRMQSAMLENQSNRSVQAATSESDSHVAAETMDHSAGSLSADTYSGDFDPLLAFSVMSAVGLICEKEGNNNYREITSDVKPENAYAQALGLESLVDLEAVSKFFQTNSIIGNERKRHHLDMQGPMNETKKLKLESNIEHGDTKGDDGVYQIRGGGTHDEGNVTKEAGEIEKQKKNGVSQMKNKIGAPIPDPSLAGYAGFDPSFTTMSQQNQSAVAAAAASHQLLQHQLGVHPDPYHAASLARQLSVPIGSHLSSLPAPDLTEFYLRNGLAGNPDWSSLQTARTGAMTQHPQLNASLGLLPGQLNLAFPEQEAARAMLLRDHQNVVAARAQGAVAAAAAAHYQASLSSLNPQNSFGLVASSLPQLHPNETQSISSLPAVPVNQPKGASSKKTPQKKSSSLSEKSSRKDSVNKGNGSNAVKSDQPDVTKRPASATSLPRSSELNSTTPNGSTTTVVSHDEAPLAEPGFALPPPPKGLPQVIADLIVHAKFHEAHSLSRKRPDESEALLIKFLLSLGAAVPVPKELIADLLVKDLSTSNYQLRLHKFVGSSSTASAYRDVVIAVISVWLWAEHKSCFKHMIEVESSKSKADSRYKWLINLAIDKTLSALATFFDSRPSGKSDDMAEETPNEQVAAIACQSLAKQVFVDNRVDASFPILEDLLKLLDSLRTNALQARTQERVLLAALASRCGNMSEAFSNAYVSSIVRAGVALGHENVCEIGQDEGCRASTMLPYDFFHDNVGVWEEPCRPITGYHPSVRGEELKKQAHARSVIQKSMKQLQNRLCLKGGISDGGPYFPVASIETSAPSTPSAVPPLVRTPSGSLKRRGSYDSLGPSGAGVSDSIFNPDHNVEHMLWNPDDIANFPYGLHQLSAEQIGSATSEKKKKKLSHSKDGNLPDQASSLALNYRSTQELEWEDVANMFFHGGSTRNIDINYDFGSNDHLGKKKIFAPFVRELDRSTLDTQCKAETEPDSDEEMNDEKILQRHQDGLDEMKLKLDTALDSRKHQSQQRGRKK